jgi:hypothetical protein
MPAVPVRHESNRPAVVQVRLNGELKNQILDAAADTGLSINDWLLNAVRAALVSGFGSPAPVSPVVTTEMVVRDYLLGNRTIGPCGAVWPCAGAERSSDHGGHRWCDECGIRFT